MSQQAKRIVSKEERQLASRREDSELIPRAVAGDQKAYARLQKKYNTAITSLIRRMLRNSDDVEDLVQETFVKAFNAIGTFNHEYAFSTWLYKIASNHCIDFLRKKRLKTFSIHQSMDGRDDSYEYEIADTSTTPDTDIQNTEKTKILQNAIDELSPKYKIVIQLRHEEELDYQDIADRLGLPLGTVKAHLFRAREILYKKLKNKEFYFYS